MSETLELPAADAPQQSVETPASDNQAPSPERSEAGDSLRDIITAAYRDSAQTGRDEQGRFTSSTATEAPSAQPVAETKNDQPDAEAPASERPAAWSEAEWQDLSPQTREAIARRERDLQSALETRAQDSQEMDRYRQAIAPFREEITRHGVDEVEAVRRTLEWAHEIGLNPREGIARLATAYGVDLRSLVSTDQQHIPQQPQAFHDPRLDQILAEQQRAKEAAEREANAKEMAELAAFQADSRNAHFDAVRHVMGGLITADGKLSLADAYDRAVWADPKLREALIEAEIQKRESARKKADAERAKAARSASVSVRDSAASGANGHHMDLSKMNLRDELRMRIRGEA